MKKRDIEANLDAIADMGDLDDWYSYNPGDYKRWVIWGRAVQAQGLATSAVSTASLNNKQVSAFIAEYWVNS